MKKLIFIIALLFMCSPIVYADIDLTGQYWFGGLSADADTWIPWWKMGTVLIDGNNWSQEWDANDGHHSFSDTFTTSVQLDGSLDIEFTSDTYNVAWNGNMMVHADASPDVNNHLGVDIIARKATDLDVNDLTGRYSFFGHWLGTNERWAGVAWGHLDVTADGNAVATWVDQDGNDHNVTAAWTLDDANAILHVAGRPDIFLCEGGIILSFRRDPVGNDIGYNFFVKESNEPLSPNDVTGNYLIRFLENSVFGQPFTCGKGTALLRADGRMSVDAYYSDGEHDVSDANYTLDPNNKFIITDDPNLGGIVGPNLDFIFLCEYVVPDQPQWYDWIGGIFLVRTVCNIADLDEDRYVDSADYAAFGDQWYKTDPNLPANFNHDSLVDWLDFKIFSDNWLWQAAWYTP